MFLVSSYQKVRWYKKLDIPLKICYSVIVRLREKEFLMIGAPPSVGGGGPARLPRERIFYINETKIQNRFSQPYRKECYGKN